MVVGGFLIKMPCYSVTMAITKFLWMEFNRVTQEELVSTQVVDFGEGLVIVFVQILQNAYVEQRAI